MNFKISFLVGSISFLCVTSYAMWTSDQMADLYTRLKKAEKEALAAKDKRDFEAAELVRKNNLIADMTIKDLKERGLEREDSNLVRSKL
jgi:hypothetical protein